MPRAALGQRDRPMRGPWRESPRRACRHSWAWKRGPARAAVRAVPGGISRMKPATSSPMVSARQVVAMPINCGVILPDRRSPARGAGFPAAEDGRGFAEVRRGDVQRLLEVADHVAADVRRAALRAVQEGDRPFHAPECQASPQRGAKLAGVAGRPVNRSGPFAGSVASRRQSSHGRSVSRIG